MSKNNSVRTECVITIELGTSAVRVFAFELNGTLIGSARGTYPTFHPEPDYSEQDPEQIFITLLFVLKNFLNETIYPKKYVVATIGFSAAMHSVLAVDKNGSPLGNVMTWADNRGKHEAQELKSGPAGRNIYRATGTPLHPMSPLIKITWMRNKDNERFKKAARFLSIKSYIIQQITGEYIIDYSLASATGLFNIHQLTWDEDAMNYAGITASKLPELVSVFQSAGRLRKEYQTSLGLSADTKIITGSSDGCMATLGAGVSGEGKATLTIEDSGAMRVMGKNMLVDDKQRFFNYVLTEGIYVSGGPTNNGGIIFEWFAKQFGDFTNAYDTDSCMQELIKKASKVEAGSEGLLFLPYLLGERAPIWNANARGVYFGININHEQKHFIRATIEGIIYELYSIGKTLEEHRSIKSLSVNGSFATIPFCTQMIADIFNKPVTVGEDTSSVGLGTFLLCATEMGIYKNLEEAGKGVVFAETFKPNTEKNDAYKCYESVFEKLSTNFNDVFESISNLQQKH